MAPALSFSPVCFFTPQALEVLTSAVEYGLDDLRKVRPSPHSLGCLLLNTWVLGGRDGQVMGGDVRRARDCTFSPLCPWGEEGSK